MSQETIDVVPQTKMYVLLEHTKSSANVYLQVSKSQRVKIDERPVDHAFNQITFMDREGKNKTIRLKLNCDEIFQDRQIKEFLIPANEKWTQEERDAVMFKYGTLVTNNPTVQKFLETSPQFDKFWEPDEKGRVGKCVNIKRPMYTLYNEDTKLEEESKSFAQRVAAANKIMAIKDVKEGQELMIRLNGSFFKAPDKLLKIQSELIRFLDEATPAMLDKLLSDEVTIDEKATILIGKAINMGIVSFDHVPNEVVLMLGNKKTKTLKEISSEYSPEDRKKYFQEFLTSKEGQLMNKDIEKLVDEKEGSKNKKK